MKTPREILLKRHQAVAPKLDAIRQSAVAAVCDRRTSSGQAHQRRSQTAATAILRTIWLELIRPCRWTWTGLAAVWVLIFTVNVSMRAQFPVVADKSSPAAGMVTAWRQQEQLLTELLGSSGPGEAEPQKQFTPKPRTERNETMTV